MAGHLQSLTWVPFPLVPHLPSVLELLKLQLAPPEMCSLPEVSLPTQAYPSCC